MTPEERSAARERARAERRAQGLPEHVEDEAVLDAIAALVRAGAEPPRGTEARGGANDNRPDRSRDHDRERS